MDRIKLLDEIKQITKLCHHYERQLKHFDLQMNDLPIDILTLLDQCVDIQKQTNLHELSLPSLKIYYFNRKKEHLECTANIQQLQNEIEDQNDEMAKDEKQCHILEKFVATCNERLKKAAEMKSTEILIESKNSDLKKRLKNINIPKDFNIDELINNVELVSKQLKK